MLAPTISAIMDCLKNRDCLNRHEHLCNMQNGMWTRNYVLTPKNNTFEGEKIVLFEYFSINIFDPQIFFIQLYRYVEQLDSCSCCFLPDVFKTKSSQRSLLESVLTLESVTSYLITGRPKPCAPLRKACNVTSDCCTGYCSVVDEYTFPGFCTDPNMAMYHGVGSGNALSGTENGESGYRFNRGNRFLASSTIEKERSASAPQEVAKSKPA